tara:strand:- start:191 stop:937 length:747 start_codon:yes stop_codon:yes gene_type:complete
MKYLIVGATSGLGRELAYTFAKKKHNLILAARDDRDLQAIKSDLSLKFGVEIKTISIDFSEIEEINKKILSDNEVLSNLNGVLFPIGFMVEKDDLLLDATTIQKIIFSNYISTNYLISKFFEIFKNQEFTIVGFGSVSGLLGRNLNINYAAAKRALESFFESLAFQKQKNNFLIQFYTLGYLDTNLSFGKKLNLPRGDVKKISEIVYKNKNKKFIKKFYPFYWSVIGLLLKVVPFNFILNIKNFINKD